MIRIDIATLFPDMCESVLSTSIVGRGREAGFIEIECHDIRRYTDNKHNRVDDKPYGGGTGMVMQAQPIYDCICDIRNKTDKNAKIIYMSPQGKTLTQSKVRELSALDNIIILCGHYEGVDQRVLDELQVEEISVGDYVLTGGELPALTLVDAIARMQDGVLPNSDAYSIESHYNGMLEHPQYSRPEEWRGRRVPEVLLTGHHENILKWQEEMSFEVTKRKRPELLFDSFSGNKPYAKYVRVQGAEPDKNGRKPELLTLMGYLARKRVLTNREIKQWKRAEIWFKENIQNPFCADCPKNTVVYLKTENAQDILRTYSALIDILIAHEIPYEVVFSDFIGNKLWENELMAGFEMTDKTMSDVEN